MLERCFKRYRDNSYFSGLKHVNFDFVLGHKTLNIKIKTKQEIFVKRFDATSIMFTVRW